MLDVIDEHALEMKPLFVKPECPLTAKALKELFIPKYTKEDVNPSIYVSEVRTYSFWGRWIDGIEKIQEENKSDGTYNMM